MHFQGDQLRELVAQLGQYIDRPPPAPQRGRPKVDQVKPDRG